MLIISAVIHHSSSKTKQKQMELQNHIPQLFVFTSHHHALLLFSSQTFKVISSSFFFLVYLFLHYLLQLLSVKDLLIGHTDDFVHIANHEI